MGLRFCIFGSLPDLLLCDIHCHMWVHCIVTTKLCFQGLCGIIWFLIILFESFYQFRLHYPTAENNNTIFFVIATIMCEFTMLILQNYWFDVCVISFGFYSTHDKYYINLPWIHTQQRTAAPFHITHVISYCDFQMLILYQGSNDCCKGDRNSDIFFLLLTSQTFHYCDQSLLAIFPDLNIFVWSITIFDLI